MDQIVHPQQREEVKKVFEAVAGRMLEVKSNLMKLHNSVFVAFDEILIDLKLTPDVLDIRIPRYCRTDRCVFFE